MAFDLNEPLYFKEVEQETEYLKASIQTLYEFAARASHQGTHPAVVDALYSAYYAVRLAQEKVEWAQQSFPRG